MDLEVKDKILTKDKIINFLGKNKLKLIFFVITLVVFLISVVFIKINNEKKNKINAENYIKAELLLNAGKKEESLSYYEKIIESKNKFYSILALNNIVEKNLISDQDKIIEYFSIVNDILKEEEQKDLLNFKKALYLLKNNKNSEGEKILNSLIDKKSKFTKLSEEVLKK